VVVGSNVDATVLNLADRARKTERVCAWVLGLSPG
jgi:hypothetical protein